VRRSAQDDGFLEGIEKHLVRSTKHGKIEKVTRSQHDEVVGVLTKDTLNRQGLLLVLLLLVCAGCRSRFVDVTIVNQGPTVHVVEFDYPSASFGANMLTTGASYHYRFKVQGPGLLSLQFEDASGHTRTAQGPKVELGDQGSLLVKIGEGGAVTWAPNLTNPK
jgi:hypothetical protein